MATEIEHKFLVTGDSWRADAHASQDFEQGYLCGDGPASVRVRVEGSRANMNVKAAVVGSVRAEYEYPIPIEAEDDLPQLSLFRVMEEEADQ